MMDFNILGAIFVVVVIAGMGSLPGAYVASVLISVLGVFGVAYLPHSTLVLMFVVMALVLMIRPYGLFGRAEVAGEHGQVGEPERPIKPAGRNARIWVALGLLVLAAVPVFGSSFSQVLITDIIIFCLFAASLHFMLGLGGMVSFGHAAYFGGGAYVAALLVSYANTPMELALILAPIGAGMLAFLIGWFCIRLTGVYFAMLTLAFAQLLWSLVFQWGEVTGGDDGMVDLWPSAWLNSTSAYYYLTLVLGVGSIILLRHVAHSPFGYALRASRDSSRQAEATGINTQRMKWAAFTLAGMMAGLAGGLFLFSKGSIFPSEMETAKSFDGLIVLFLGGVKTLSGAVVGAASLELVKDLITRLEYWRLMLGLLIIGVVILAPEGIVGSLQSAKEKLGLSKQENNQ
jgi:branched-chain amino acid transport system permease protein